MSRSLWATALTGALLLPAWSAFADCPADPAWFEAPEAFDSSEPADPLDECAFYQRSWAAFLHVTRPSATGAPTFLGFTSYRDLFAPRPVGMPPPRAVASSLTLDGGVDQAMSAAVIDGNGNPLHYSIAFDPVFAGFVRQTGLNRLDTLMDARLQADFPDGAMELKAAWQILLPGESGDGFLVTSAPIPPVGVEDGSLVLAGGAAEPGRVAMLGLHVVFRLANHPEMIWATFEHVGDDGEPDLAPRAAALPDGPDAPDPGIAVSDAAGYRLYAAGTSYEAANQSVWPLPEAPAERASARSSIYRAFPYAQAAGVEDSDPLVEDEDIVALNDDVGHRFAPDDPRRHYRLIGAVWLRDGAAAFRVGEEIDDAALSGERALSNVALESLTQVVAPNCFSCHAPVSESGLPDRSINISRVFAKFAYGP